MSDHQEIWCQPSDQPKRQFLVLFDDPQMDLAVFDDERKARDFWEKANLNWNCYLMGTLQRSGWHSKEQDAVLAAIARYDGDPRLPSASQILTALATAVSAHAPDTATEFMGISLDDIRASIPTSQP